MGVAATLPQLTFEKTVELADAREAIWHVWRHTKLNATVVVWIAAALVGGFAGSRVPGAAPFWFNALVVAIVLAIFLASFIWFQVARIAKRQIKRSATVGSEVWVVNDEGIKVESSQGQVQLRWTALRGYVETKGLVIVRQVGTALAIPKRCLSEDQHTALLRFFQANNLPLLRW